MRAQKERKRTFLTAFEHRRKEASSLFAGQYWYRSGMGGGTFFKVGGHKRASKKL